MTKQPRLFLSFAVLSVLAAAPAAFAQEACSRVFDADPYSWLEEGGAEKNAWVQTQTGRVNAFVKTSRNRGPIEEFLKEYYSAPNLADIARRGDVTVTIQDRGLGRGKSVDVEVERGGVKRTVLSSYDFKRNNSVVPVELSLSPDGAYVLVKTAKHGQLDFFDAVLIETATGRRLGEYKDLDSGSPVWFSRTEVHFDEAGPGAAARTVRIADGAARLGTRPEGAFFRASEDGQWAFTIRRDADGKATMIVKSTVDKRIFAMPALPVRRIFSADRDGLWIQSHGRERFGEIVRVRLAEKDGKTKAEALDLVVPESKRVIESATIEGGRLVLSTFLGGSRSVRIYEKETGKLQHEVEAPGCCAMFFGGLKTEGGSTFLSATLSSPARRRATWRFDLGSRKWFLEENGARREADPAREMMSDGGVEFVTTYHVYKSKDGTEIPVRIAHRKDVVFDGNNPVLLEGYGGFASNNYFHPEFNPMRLEFLRAGGVHVAPALRGSSFFGEAWHVDGAALKKQNVIDDFIGAAEWAVAAKITSPRRIAITGDSHGGLLVGASLVQRPDLFGLAFPQFGPHDFSRKADLDPRTTPYQVSEYGDLITDPAAIANAARLSPFLNAKPAIYPMTVVITGQKDSRVNPDHSFRFAARLQDSQRGTSPIFMYSLKNSGHWMKSEDRQDVIGFRGTATFWTILFDHQGLRMKPAVK